MKVGRSAVIIIVWILLLIFMLLTTPTIEELQNLELGVLIDMLAEQTAFYTKYIKEIGFSGDSESYRQLIVDLQAVIELKLSRGTKSPATVAVNNFNSYKKYRIR